jgi:hypothetical protein
MSGLAIALLTKRDEPTAAIEEYCRVKLEIRRMPWEIHDALHALQFQGARWRDTWVLVQYTVLAWSAWGLSKSTSRPIYSARRFALFPETAF